MSEINDKEKSITFAVYSGIFLFFLVNAIGASFAFSNFESDCLKDGGVYSKTISGIIASQTCTYPKTTPELK